LRARRNTCGSVLRDRQSVRECTQEKGGDQHRGGEGEHANYIHGAKVSGETFLVISSFGFSVTSETTPAVDIRCRRLACERQFDFRRG
jgi:hypothetical protein